MQDIYADSSYNIHVFMHTSVLFLLFFARHIDNIIYLHVTLILTFALPILL